MRRLSIFALVVLCGTCLPGCGSSQASATKEEQAHYGDRNPADIHAPPSAGPQAPRMAGPGGPPPGAATAGAGK